MSKPSSSSSPSAPKFKPGARVEIRSGDPGIRGPWYSGIVVRRKKSNPNFYVVQYDKLFEDELDRNLLQKAVDCRKLRPKPPVDKEKKKIGFKFGDEVDAYQNDGWWEGTIVSERPDGKFVVSFGSLKDHTVFGEKDLRVRMDWIDGKWKLHSEQRSVEETVTTPSEVMKRQKCEHVNTVWKASSVVKETSTERTETRPYKVMKCTKSDRAKFHSESVEFVKEKNFSASAEHSKDSKFPSCWKTSSFEKERSTEKAETRPYKVTRRTKSDHVKVNNASGGGESEEFANEKKFSARTERSNDSEFPTTGKKKKTLNGAKEFKFVPEMEVEVTSDEEGFRGTWYEAKIIEPSGKDKYLVEYKTLTNDAETEFLREDIRTGYIRPRPPKFVAVDGFEQMDKVDAYYNEGWWEGTIVSERPDGKFVVSFGSLKDHTVFGEKDLRVRMDWIDGKWKLHSEQRSVEETETTPSEVMKRQKCEHVKVVKGKKLSASAEHSENSKFHTVWKASNVVKEISTERTETMPYKVMKCTKSDRVKVHSESVEFVKEKNFSASAEHSKNSEFPSCWKTSSFEKERSTGKTETRPYKVTRRTKSDHVKVNNASGGGESEEFANEKKFSARTERSNNSEFPSTGKKKKTLNDAKEFKFVPEMEVEVTSDEEGFRGTWYEAKIIEPSGKDKYLVEYKTLTNDAETEFLREDIRTGYIRPRPPKFVAVDGFEQMDKVNAYYNEGWWVGVVEKARQDCKYTVYFKETDEKMVFKESYLRPHHDWSNGEWIVPLKAEKL